MIRKGIIFIIIIGNVLLSRQRLISSWERLSLKDKISQMIMVRVNGNYYHSDSS